jgi:predicted RNase H-like nuclease (RuvC/YqgF family)
MLREITLRMAALSLVFTAFPVCYLAAQETQDAPSVAEAARRARQQKEAAAAKPSHVITNDQIPSAPTDASAAAPATPPTGTNAESTAKEGDEKAGSTEENAEVTALKKEIKEKEEAASVLLRELALDRDTFYGNPDYQRDLAGKQKLDDLQATLTDKQNELQKLKAKLTEIAGADALKEPAKEPAPATPPASPQQ